MIDDYAHLLHDSRIARQLDRTVLWSQVCASVAAGVEHLLCQELKATVLDVHISRVTDLVALEPLVLCERS